MNWKLNQMLTSISLSNKTRTLPNKNSLLQFARSHKNKKVLAILLFCYFQLFSFTIVDFTANIYFFYFFLVIDSQLDEYFRGLIQRLALLEYRKLLFYMLLFIKIAGAKAPFKVPVVASSLILYRRAKFLHLIFPSFNA